MSDTESVNVCILEHPTFVYCARFHPASPNAVVVTGSYDKVVRIWTKSESGDDADDLKFEVSQVNIWFGFWNETELIIAVEMKFPGVDLPLKLRNITGVWI